MKLKDNPPDINDEASEPGSRLLLHVHEAFSGREASLGTIGLPTKLGLLTIAAMGRDTWNTWIENYHGIEIDFSGTTFSKAENNIDFRGFKFPTNKNKRSVIFSSCLFQIHANFEETEFGDSADFSNAVFEKTASFQNSKISRAYFSSSNFHGIAVFDKTSFSAETYFDGCSFLAATFFCDSIFLDTASFSNCKFSDGIILERTTFQDACLFDNSEFLSDCFFSGSQFMEAYFRSTKFSSASYFQRCIFKGDLFFDIDGSTESSSDPANIGPTSFAGSKFLGNAFFTNRNFLSTADFGTTKKEGDTEARRAEFHGLPLFHGCKFHQDTNFDNAEFQAPAGPEAARAYRTLKLAMEQMKATREEQKFFRLEMKAEHPALPLGKRWASTLYNLFSDYGFSLWRPLAWLIVFTFVFGIGYGMLANACAAESQCAQTAWAANTGSADDRTSAVIKYTLASVSPVPGLDKMQTELRAPLFGHHGWIPITALVLEIFHKITSLIMVFLFALALRNLFKMKS